MLFYVSAKYRTTRGNVAARAFHIKADCMESAIAIARNRIAAYKSYSGKLDLTVTRAA
jgi:hypothetical protein